MGKNFMFSVLVVSPNPSVPGGVSVFIEGVKRNVTQTRIDSFFVGSSGKGDEPRWKIATRLVVAPFQLVHRVMMNAYKYDAVHINPSFDVKSLIRDGLFLLALRMVGYRRILFYFHGWNSKTQQTIVNNRALSLFAAWILNRAGLITVLGDAFRDDLVMIGVDPSRIMVTRTMFEGCELEATIEAKALPTTRSFILFLSRFDREKGGRELVEAFAGLEADYPDLDLILAGDGNDMRSLRELVEGLGLQKRVLFVGYVSGAQKAQLLTGCSVFALPTYYRGEGMPVAVLEAMGAGKPLLVGSAGALHTIVSDPENGVVLRAITVEAVNAGLRRLLSDRAFAERAGKNNADLAWSKFEAHIVTREIETFYQKVATC